MHNDELAEKIIEQANDAIIYADIHGYIQKWNAAASKLFGFSKDEAIGESLDIIIPEKIRAAHWRGFHAAIQNSKLQLSGKPTRTKGLHKDESKKLYVEMSFAIIKNDDGIAEGSVAIARDITDSMINKKT